jgi:protein-L-isoaspartate(D-aspartate) O-methyltransferase
MTDEGQSVRRTALVAHLRRRCDVSDARVLEAFARIPRHLFVVPDQVEHAYEDRALPLVEGQTISQPTMIGIMLQALACEPRDRALEIGAGCGYAAALLGQLVSHVDAIELRVELARAARANLVVAGVTNVTVHDGDGQHGMVGGGPFQRILVSAGAPSVSAALLEQLALGGRIAVPVDDGWGQVLRIGERSPTGSMSWWDSVRCVFVPLVTRPLP